MSQTKLSRIEDQRFITGQGRYSADLNLPEQAYAYFVRADRAHAEIGSIDVEAARAVPGVLGVFTSADTLGAGFQPLPIVMPYKGIGGSDILRPRRVALAEGKVRFVGEPVALVVATSAAIAQDAAEQVVVDYRELPAVTTPAAAIAPGAPRLFDHIPDNTIFDMEIGDAARVDAAFAQAAHKVKLDVHVSRVVAIPMEPRACIAQHDRASDAYTLYSSTQGVTSLRGQIAGAMGISEDKLTVAAWDVGGGFGARFNAYPEHLSILLAAKVIGRPVKWVSSRTESFLSEEHARGVDATGEVAIDANGRFLAMRFGFLADIGAYCVPVGAFINTGGIFAQLTGVYDLPAIHARSRLALTNTAPIGAYRGAGRPIISYAIERLVDEASRVTGIDRVELRRRNAVPAARFPYAAAHGKTWDSGDFAGVLEHAIRAADWDGYPARKAASAQRGLLRGRGLACWIEETGGGFAPHDEVDLRFGSDKDLTLYAVSHNHGQGHETVFAQIIANILGISMQTIKLRNGAPEQPRLVGNATGGSRTALGMGSAMRQGALEVVEKGRKLAADRFEAAPADIEFDQGTYRVVGTDRSVTMRELIDAHAGQSPHPLDVRTKLKTGPTYPNGCHIVEVEIDPQTGVTKIVKYTATDDVGNVLNHQLMSGQIHGGVVQAVGQIFGEHAVYDPTSGQLLTGSFMDYTMPRAGIVRDLEVVEHPVPTGTNPLGAKGAGEGGNTGGLPATMSAIVDALAEVGVKKFDMPATPARVWQAIQAARMG